MASKSEVSYIQSSICSEPPIRADGRSLADYRAISLTTGVVALANGSARVNLGGTDIIAACKLEVEDVKSTDWVNGGRISCMVSCSPSAYPHSSPAAIEDIQYDLSQVLNSVLGDISLRPSNLVILPHKTSWLLNLDCIVLSDCGNIYDALFAAARAALWDTRVPITQAIDYKAPQRPIGDESGLDTRQLSHAADFELADYWSEGDVLDGRDKWPVCITLNLLPSRQFLDATLQEEAATPLRLLLVFSCPASGPPALHGIRLIGTGDVSPTRFASLLKDGEKYATELVKSLVIL